MHYPTWLSCRLPLSVDTAAILLALYVIAETQTKVQVRRCIASLPYLASLLSKPRLTARSKFSFIKYLFLTTADLGGYFYVEGVDAVWLITRLLHVQDDPETRTWDFPQSHADEDHTARHSLP